MCKREIEMGNPNITWQRVEHRRMRMKKAGCIIDGKVQHDWGEWGEWHYHKYNFYYPRRRIGLIATTIGGRGYEQRVRVCRRCRAREFERRD